MSKHIGTVTQIIGPVLDIRFPDQQLPALLNAIEIPLNGSTITAEVAQHIGDNVVRCIAMSSTDSLQRGAEAVDTGAPIRVPVGDECLGRVFNLLGQKGSVTKIVNTLYGNWTLKDDTGDVYIYGTLDANGQEKNFESLGLAEGDEVYLSGPKTTYNGTVELVNVTIHKINKAFIKLNENSVEVDKEAGSIEIPLTLMDGAKWTASTDEDWLTIGTTHLDEGNTILTVDYAAYDELKAPRTGVITFSATKEVEEENEEGEKEKVTKSAFLEYKVTQYGIVPKPVSVKDAAAAEKNAWIAVEGIVTAVCGDGIIVTDKDGDFILGYKAEAELGDEVILYGKRAAYNKSYQLASPVVEVKSKGNKYTYPVATPVTEEFIADLAAASGDQLAKFVTYTGVVNDNKYNTLNVGENYVISPYTSSDFLMKNAKGKTVTIEGYTYGYKSSANQLNVIVTSLKYAE